MNLPDIQLVAIDVDGTLIGPDGVVEPDVAEALHAASRRVRICLATGRSYVETLPVWRQVNWAGRPEPLILVGGAMVAEPDTGRTLWHRPIDREVACRFADALAEAGCAAMAFYDAWRCGVDYVLTGLGDVDAAEKRWFGQMNVRLRRARQLTDAADLPAPLRISAVVEPPEAAAELAGRLQRRFSKQLNVHSIFAPNYGVTVVEAHDAAADKARAVAYVAQAYRIPLSRVAAVGDDVNDLSMITSAGLGVAMPRATDAVRAAADLLAADGLAAFLRQLANP